MGLTMSVRRITQPRYHNADLWRTSSGCCLHGFMKKTGWQIMWRPWNGGFDVVLERSHRKLYKLPWCQLRGSSCERIDLDLLMSAIDLILFNMLQIITAFYCLVPNCNTSRIYGPLKIGALISYTHITGFYPWPCAQFFSFTSRPNSPTFLEPLALLAKSANAICSVRECGVFLT